VGLNLLYVVPGRVGGTETYARELVRALAMEAPATEWTAYVGSEAADAFGSARWPQNVRLRPIRIPSAIKPLRVGVELAHLPRAASRDRVEVLHSLGTTAPFRGDFARVVTIHDLIYHHFPETFPAAARRGLEYVVPRAARAAHRVIADSQATKQDLADTYGVDAAKIDVVHLGLGMTAPDAVTPEPQLRKYYELDDRPVLLSVAAALAHKNVDGLLRAFAALEHPSRPLLVITGHAGRDQRRLSELALGLGVARDVRFTGWIEAADLEGLYRLSEAFVYPSKFEGFGLPVLEAMHRGVPVATSGATSLAEVAGDAALIFDPADDAAITTAIRRLLDDELVRDDLIRRGRERAASFTWQRAARETLASYRRALQARA
jgi:glycosyltransferase involved in cell wall biosynthesis